MSLNNDEKEYESKKIVRHFLVRIFILILLSILCAIVLQLFINQTIVFIIFIIVVLSISFYLVSRLYQATEEWKKNFNID